MNKRKSKQSVVVRTTTTTARRVPKRQRAVVVPFRPVSTTVLQVNGKSRAARRRARRRNRRGADGMSIPKSVSMVSDGINTGSVWRNRAVERVTFPVAFEKVADINTTATAFTIIKQFYLNPGNSLLHPIFSQIANVYEEFIPNVFRFWWRGEAYAATGTTTSAGIIVMATNFDPDDGNFSGVDQMENYEHSVSGPPFTGVMCHDVLEARKVKGKDLAMNNYFVYSSANQETPLTGAGKFYDFGNFQLASNGTQTASPAGELWVEYSYTMIRRKQQTPIGQGNIAAHYISTSTSTAAAPFGTLTQQTNSTISLTLSSTNCTISLPGRYLVVYQWVGSTVSAASSWGAGSGATLVTSDMQGGTASTFGCFQTNTAFSSATVVDIATGGGTLTFTGGTFSGATGVDLFVVQIPGALKMFANRDCAVSTALFNRVGRLEQMLKRLTMVSEEPESDAEIISESNDVDMCRSLHLSSDEVRRLLNDNSKGTCVADLAARGAPLQFSNGLQASSKK